VQRRLILANIRELYDNVYCTHPQSEPKGASVSRLDEASPMKKATQSTQALISNIIRLSWLKYFLITLRYMEIPEHSIPQTWMCPTKVNVILRYVSVHRASLRKKVIILLGSLNFSLQTHWPSLQTLTNTTHPHSVTSRRHKSWFLHNSSSFQPMRQQHSWILTPGI
jgi:hypothetical protein